MLKVPAQWRHRLRKKCAAQRFSVLTVLLLASLLFLGGCDWLTNWISPPPTSPIYATSVVGFDIDASGSEYTDPSRAEGPPDETDPWTGRFVSLGAKPGYIIATMSSCFTAGVGTDIRIHEVGATQGGKDEEFDVFLSYNGLDWVNVADDISNDPGQPFASIDLDLLPRRYVGPFRFVMIAAVTDSESGESPGPDIDAIEAMFPLDCD